MKLAINNEALAGAINRQDEKMVLRGDQFRTGAQQRLERDVTRKTELQSQIAEDEAQLVDLRSQLARLESLIVKGESNVKDAKSELRGVLSSIHDLERDGITI